VKVQILGQIMEYNNNGSEMERMFEEIESLLEQHHLHLSAMKIDSIEIFGDFKDYIMEHVREIEIVEVEAHTVGEMVNQVLLSTEQYLERALPPMQQLPREFYQGPTGDSWDNLGQAAEGIQWIYQMVLSVIQAEPVFLTTDNFRVLIDKLDQALPDLNEAVEAKDPIGIADGLSYEILPVINELFELVKNTIDDKVVRPHVS
jgi:hypothetical protein